MEFIRHRGDLQRAGCREVESNRVIYYCDDGRQQLYWFICAQCHGWTRLAFGYEEIGPLGPGLRRGIEKIRRFEDKGEFERYGTNW